ncbi:hypothetical protein ES703_92672 [subsurface metagenome]
MTQVDVLFIIDISGLAVYAKSQTLYIGTFVGLVLFGYQLSETSWIHSVPVFVLAVWMIFKGIVPWVRG